MDQFDGEMVFFIQEEIPAPPKIVLTSRVSHDGLRFAIRLRVDPCGGREGIGAIEEAGFGEGNDVIFAVEQEGVSDPSFH